MKNKYALRWICFSLLLTGLLLPGCRPVAHEEASTTVMVQADTAAGHLVDTLPQHEAHTVADEDPQADGAVLAQLVQMDAKLRRMAEDSAELKLHALRLSGDSVWVVEAILEERDEVRLVAFERKARFTKVMSLDYDACRYAGVEVLDADFDGHEDLLVKDYSCVGCCPRDISVVYLFKGGTLRSEPAVETMNGYFDGENRTVQQMDYGHPPYISLSKWEWSADTLRQVESIGYNVYLDNEAELGYVMQDPPYVREVLATGATDTLWEVPEEYEGVYDAEWFER